MVRNWLLQLWEGQTGLKSARQAVRKGWQNFQVQDESAVQGRISSYHQIFNVNTPARNHLPFKAACSQISQIRVWTSLESWQQPLSGHHPSYSCIHSLIFPRMVHLRARPVLRTGGIEGGHVEAEAVRETNGCGTEWRSGSEDFGDTVGGTIQEERMGRLPFKEGGTCLWGQGLCQGLREARARKEGDALCRQMYSLVAGGEGIGF